MAGLEAAALGGEPACERDWMDLGLVDPPVRSGANGQGGAPAPPQVNNSAVWLIAGTFAPDVGRIWGLRRVGEYLAAPDARRHLWHACLAAPGELFRSSSGHAAEASYARLSSCKGKHLLAQAYGVDAAGLLGALGRLGPTARAPEAYRALVTVMAGDGAGATLLRHAVELPDELILAVAAVPPAMCCKALVRQIKDRGLKADDVGFFVWALGRLVHLRGPEAAEAILAAPKPLEALISLSQGIPFGPPPWPGDDRLRPITSPLRLHAIGKAFENCLAHTSHAEHAVTQVRNGAKYFYEWLGRQPALLEFQAIAPLGWHMATAEGAKGASLSLETRAEIAAALAQSVVMTPLYPPHPYEWHGGFRL